MYTILSNKQILCHSKVKMAYCISKYMYSMFYICKFPGKNNALNYVKLKKILYDKNLFKKSLQMVLYEVRAAINHNDIQPNHIVKTNQTVYRYRK
jgi:hypothetical protein